MINMIFIFEVWRPTNTDGCYSLVGSNFRTNGVNLSNPTQSELEGSSLCIGATGDINTQNTASGASVITAVIGKDSRTPFHNAYTFLLP